MELRYEATIQENVFNSRYKIFISSIHGNAYLFEVIDVVKHKIGPKIISLAGF